MAATFRIDTERGVVLTKMEGVVTDDELLVIQRELRDDPRFRPDLNTLVDATEVTVAKLTANGLREAGQASPFGAGSRRALVAQAGGVVYGMARMFEMLADLEPVTTRVFDNLAEAKAWLGLPDEQS
jgi:hypothetical protein